MSTTLCRPHVVAGLLLLTAGAAYLVVSVLDPDGGPATSDPMDEATHAASGQDGDLSAEAPRARAGPTLRARARLPQPDTPSDAPGARPAPPEGTQLIVTDASDKPAAGVAVTVDGSTGSGVTDKSGILRLPAEASRSRVSISGPGFETVHLMRPAGAVLVVLEGIGVLVGTVRDADGVAVTGAKVFATRPGRTTPVSGRPAWAADTGSDGAFRLTRLPPGDWDVQARLGGQADRPAMEARHRCALPGARDVVLVLGRARDVRGRVTGPDGRLPPGTISVVMRGVRPDGGDGAAWFGTVAKDGSYVIKGVGSGTNVLWAWTSDRDSRLALTILRDVRPGTSDLQIELDVGEAIEGTLVDDRGDPVKGGGWLYAFDGDVLVNGVSLLGKGTFRTHLLPRGRVYDITLVSTSGWTGTVGGVAAGTSGLVVRGRRMPPLTGSVLLPDGSAAGAGIEVRAKAPGIGADQRSGAAVRVSTDADGRFSIPKLGDFSFVVTTTGGSRYAPARVPGTVRPGANVQLHLQPPQSLTGRVALASSEPAVGVVLWVLPEDRAFAGWRVNTDKRGRFNVANLPYGAVRFVLDTLDGEVEVGRAVVPAEDVVITLPARRTP